MQGAATNLLKFMGGNGKRFLIPVYQRNYDWKIANCSRLFEDLVTVSKKNRNNHFFGSIVAVVDSEVVLSQDFLIIDGQQRITTVSLLLLAMYNLLQKGEVTSLDPSLARKIYTIYLVDEFADDDAKVRLKPVKNDNKAFNCLFGNEDEYIQNSNLTRNYEYFCTQIKKNVISIDELYSSISKLIIICIQLNHEDNPQLIFESLNSTGLDLTEGDKIRNYVLMGQKPDDQEKFYEKYWNPIEELTNYDTSTFIRDWLSIKTGAIPAIGNVYEVYKKYSISLETEIEEQLKELYLYAKYYQILQKGYSSSDNLNFKISSKLRESIKRLNWLEATVTRPYFLEALKLYYAETIDLDTLEKVFGIVEGYLFRRNVCEIASNALNKIFVNLNKEIYRLDGNYDDYCEKMKYILTTKKESGRFPNDEEFRESLSERNVYNMRGRFRTYVLERYENFGTLETKDIYKALENGTYSIEHIMPQHLTPVWINELGVDYKRIHEEWLHRLANLTLTAYNSNYSNEPFSVKKTLTDSTTGNGIGFANSGIRMNQWIAKKEKWTEEELLERNEELLSQAMTIWPYINTSYLPEEKSMESVTLDDEVSLMGRQIFKFSLNGLEQPVKSWIDAYQMILKILYQEDETIIRELAYSKDTNKDLSAHLSVDKNSFNHSVEIADGIYVWSGINTDYKLSNLRKFFALYGANPAELTFYLKDDEVGIVQEDEMSNKKVEFWSYAIPVIQEMDSSPCYRNVKPAARNWYNGYFGLSSIHLVCIISRTEARVEMYFEKPNAQDNKKDFDNVFSHKAEIEAILGPLKWDRGNNRKSSKIYVRLGKSSFMNQDDWNRIATFMGEWVDKFYRILRPYVL